MARKGTSTSRDTAAPLVPPGDDIDDDLADVQVAPPAGQPLAATSEVRPVEEGDPLVHPPTPVATTDTTEPPAAVFDAALDSGEPAELAVTRPGRATVAAEEIVQLQRRLEAVTAQRDELSRRLDETRLLLDAYHRAEAAAATPPAGREVTPTITHDRHGAPVPASVIDAPPEVLGLRPPGTPA